MESDKEDFQPVELDTQVKFRRSDREPKPTPKMAEYQQQELERRELKLKTVYEKWKIHVRDSRKNLKSHCEESLLAEMLDSTKQMESNVLKCFESVREIKAVNPEAVRKIDACVAVTADILKVINERICEIDLLDFKCEQERLRDLGKNEYANSIFSSLSEGKISESSMRSQLSTRMADAAANLAAKQAELQLLEREKIQRAKLETELKKLDTQREIEVAKARYNAYNAVLQDTTDYTEPSTGLRPELLPSAIEPSGEPGVLPINNLDYFTSLSPTAKPFQPSSKDVPVVKETQANGVFPQMDTLAKALADSVNLNRIPIPEPSIFVGDPLQYIEWKTSFKTLIEHKGIPSEERIYYLKKYVGGSARKALEGFFYSNSSSAFEKACKVLDERYGHPFIIQKAFRDKLDRWPMVAARDPYAFRDFGDFLQGCRDAMPHVPSLTVLNDCTENQKLLGKLPDWAAVRWNREVTQSIETSGAYPSFSKFVDFVVKEAKIACNPVSSLIALNDISKKAHRDSKFNDNRVKVLATSSSDQNLATKVADCRPNTCLYCEKIGHFIFQCENFKLLPIDQKRLFVREKKLCFGCLRKGHRNSECKRKHTCGICKGKHPTCMHEDVSPARLSVDKKQREEVQTVSSMHVCGNSGHGTSMIVPVWVSTWDNPSHEILTYALLDTQSDTTFILQETMAALQAPSQPVRLSLSTMTSQNTIIESSRVTNLRVRSFKYSDSVKIDTAYTRDFIPADRTHIPVRNTVKDLPHLQEIMNELPPLQSCEVGLLIGYNCPQALAPSRIIHGKENEPYAIQTLLGWSVVGYSKLGPDYGLPASISHHSSVKELPPCSPRDVIRVLESDFAHDRREDIKFSQEDIQFINLMEGSIRQREDKHLEMPLPFKQRPMLPNNKALALMRLNHLKRKLISDSKYHDHYKKFMEGILDCRDAEPVTTEGTSGNVWYIPHHGVYHPRKPDKLRVVFDCSARYKSSSLNQHLLTGPDLTNTLTGVLCRFRQYPIAIMCDIERMFHQFIVNESDRDFLRILWWEKGDIHAEPLEYRMRVHLFGAASSPGCSNYGLKYLARIQEKTLPRAATFVQNNFYVDDGLISLEYEEEAIHIINEAQKLCANGGLRLHKFISNNKNVISSIPISERAADVKDLDLTLERLPVEQALGIRWFIDEDIFSFNMLKGYSRDATPTRSSMLSVIASIFDPLGFLAPFTLTGKRILQEMCQNGIGWNDPLTADMRPEWNAWLKDVQNLDLIKIPRCLKPSDFGKYDHVELHHFSDASSSGYGQCSYLRIVSGTRVHCALLMGKARVAPLKVVTIPRLELTAAVLSVKVSSFLKRELDIQINKEYFWTDSKVVLGYINNESRKFHVFVANRVQFIRDATEPTQWYYVESGSNPADYASRGLNTSEIMKSSWLSGPSFLWNQQFETETIDAKLQVGDPEVKAVRTLCATTASDAFINALSRFSSWPFLLSVVARLHRLSNGIKGTHIPTVDERQRAEHKIIKLVQQDAYSDILRILKTSPNVPKTSNLYPLDPILQDDLLCVGGRLRKSCFPDRQKHPIILPKDSHITKVILSHAHVTIHHQGRGITLNRLRTMGYWIVGGSKAVASFIRQCVTCRKLRRPTESQKMADLPRDRVEPSPPFTYCGMDCFGPFLIKQGRKEVKRYGVLFTCMCSRAVHIEILEDMSTDSFINALRCFVAIRGAVRQIRCDQGTNFVGAKHEFDKGMNNSKVTSFLGERQCDFIFNAPGTSHTGGVWERQIRTVRNILNGVLQLCPGRLDDSSLRTIFYEVMAIINSRPLTVSEIGNPSLEPLTPNHILNAKSCIPQPPPGEFVKEDLYLRKRWKRVQYLLEQFWARWKKEYMAQLTLRQKWHEPRRNMCVGDIVLVKDIDLPRNQWPMARVTETYPDDDGLVRRVKVKLYNSILERTIHKLVLLIEH